MSLKDLAELPSTSAKRMPRDQRLTILRMFAAKLGFDTHVLQKVDGSTVFTIAAEK